MGMGSGNEEGVILTQKLIYTSFSFQITTA